MAVVMQPLKDADLCMQIYAAIASAHFSAPINEVRLSYMEEYGVVEVSLIVRSSLGRCGTLKDRYLVISFRQRDLPSDKSNVMDYLIAHMEDAKYKYKETQK